MLNWTDLGVGLLSLPFARTVELPARCGFYHGVWQKRVPDVLVTEGEGARYQPLYLVAVPPGREGGNDAQPGQSQDQPEL